MEITNSQEVISTNQKSGFFDEWLYSRSQDNRARFVLGTVGENPLFCVGINPSTAMPNKLDNTATIIQQTAYRAHYDSWILFNLYPQRTIEPRYLDKECNRELEQENIEEIRKVFSSFDFSTRRPTVWVAWGGSITKRKYLRFCATKLYNLLHPYNPNWVCLGETTQGGHPHHPLYIKRTEPLVPFLMPSYIVQINQEKSPHE